MAIGMEGSARTQEGNTDAAGRREGERTVEKKRSRVAESAAPGRAANSDIRAELRSVEGGDGANRWIRAVAV